MADIKVVAYLVRCAADLLVCHDIDTDHLRFADAEDYRNKLPVIIGEVQRMSHFGDVAMDRCRFQFDLLPEHDAGLDDRVGQRAGVDPIPPQPATRRSRRRRRLPRSHTCPAAPAAECPRPQRIGRRHPGRTSSSPARPITFLDFSSRPRNDAA